MAALLKSFNTTNTTAVATLIELPIRTKNSFSEGRLFDISSEAWELTDEDAIILEQVGDPSRSTGKPTRPPHRARKI